MPDKSSFYITTAISYPNGEPHIGHAYEAVATDAIARFKRLDGFDVMFVTGTDEHGQKMKQTAEKQGVTPEELSDQLAPRFIKMVSDLNCSNDDFIRTTEERHKISVTEIWKRMAAKGDIYLDKYSGWYSVRDEAYYGEDELAKGEDGKFYAPTGTPVEWVEEESFFFKLSEYQQPLLDYYNKNKDFIGPETRRNEVISFVEGGLQDLSMSRTSFDWGIPVPDAPGHVMYVWVDALTNYITATGFPDESLDSYKKFWPADLHIIGKDILRFHAIYWPAFLMSAGLPLPKRVFGHGFLFNKGEKMSKSVGNVVDPFSMIEAYGVDQIRFFFLREVPFGRDGNYSHEAIVSRINADLANDLGNLAQRSLSMVAKNCGNAVPQPGEFSPEDQAMLGMADSMIEKARAEIDNQALHKILEMIWSVVAEANRYFTSQEPWALRKTDPARMNTVLYVTAETIRQVGIIIQPFMPDSAAKFLELLAVDSAMRNFSSLGIAGRLSPSVGLPAPKPVFPRYVEPADEE